MRVLYSIGIGLYGLGIRLAATLGHAKGKQMCAGWKETMKRLDDKGIGTGETVWFHVSSMGEFEQARPVLEAFKKSHNDWKIVVTFFSPSGYEVRKDYKEADCVCYLPMDTRRNAKRMVEKIRPKIVYFVKYDFWYNYMREIKRSGAKMYIFSTIFRRNQYFFKWYGGWFRKQLKGFDHLFVQNEESLKLLKENGIEQCTIAGDTRFDRVNDITKAARRFEEIETFVGDKKVLMAGSSWEPDEERIKNFVDQYKGELKLILAPHMIHEEHIQKIVALFGAENCVRYTQLQKNDMGKRVLIIDTMGMLAAMYRYATIAYIGGGFGQGIHNILEAVTFGKPVVFGPNYKKFKEAHDILERGGGKSYTENRELNEILDHWLNNEESYQQASKVCADYVAENLGATQTILKR